MKIKMKMKWELDALVILSLEAVVVVVVVVGLIQTWSIAGGEGNREGRMLDEGVGCHLRTK